ncbi:hypothetical protein D3C81_2306280 [compost metagenome]
MGILLAPFLHFTDHRPYRILGFAVQLRSFVTRLAGNFLNFINRSGCSIHNILAQLFSRLRSEQQRCH